jgi:hypothetical protein
MHRIKNLLQDKNNKITIIKKKERDGDTYLLRHSLLGPLVALAFLKSKVILARFF